MSREPWMDKANAVMAESELLPAEGVEARVHINLCVSMIPGHGEEGNRFVKLVDGSKSYICIDKTAAKNLVKYLPYIFQLGDE